MESDRPGLRLPKSARVVMLPKRAFLVPGFVDTHTHAPQHFFTGKGYDLQLLDWLNTYTFPAEAKFSRKEHAEAVCANAVSDVELNEGGVVGESSRARS